MEALTQKDFWIGASGYLSDTPDRLVEPDGRCVIAAHESPSAAKSSATCCSCVLACKAQYMMALFRGCRKNFVPVSPFHYGDGRLHVVFMGSGYYAAQVHDHFRALVPSIYSQGPCDKYEKAQCNPSSGCAWLEQFWHARLFDTQEKEFVPRLSPLQLEALR